MVRKAIVPVAGWGTRRLPITKILEKSMLPVGNRPLVDYAVQDLIKAGVKDIYMVVSNAQPCQVRDFYHENWALNQYLRDRGKIDALKLAKTLPDGVQIHYVAQDPSGKYGTAVPVALVMEKYNLTEPVLVFMGDDFIWNPEGESAAETLLRVASGSDETETAEERAEGALGEVGEEKPKKKEMTAAILGVEVDPSEVERYGVLSVENGRLTGIVEKPARAEAPSNLINVSKYVMTPELLKRTMRYVNRHDFEPGEEYMLTEPIAQFIKDGGEMRVARAVGQYLDGGTVEGWVHANNVVCRGKD